MFFGTKDGLFRFDGKEFKLYYGFNNPEFSKEVNFIYKDTWNNIWITCNGRVYCKKKNSDLYEISTTIKNQNPYIGLLFVQKNNLLVVHSDTILHFLILQSGELQLIDKRQHIGKTADQINEIISDSDQENLWISTEHLGLIKYNLKTHAMERYFNDTKSGLEKIEINIFRSIVNYKNEIFCGTYLRGLFVFNLVSKKFRQIIPKSKVLTQNELQQMAVRTLKIINDKLWIGTANLGLLIMDLNTLEIEIYQSNTNSVTSINNNNIRRIFRDNQNNVWICTGKGICMASLYKKPVVYHGVNAVGSDPLNSAARKILFTNLQPNKIYLLHFLKGIIEYDFVNKKSTENILFPNKSTYYTSAGFIDPNKILVSTNRKLFTYNIVSKNYSPFITKNYITQNGTTSDIYNYFADQIVLKNNVFFISRTEPLTVLNLNSMAMQTPETKDGLSTGSRILFTRDSSIYIADYHGGLWGYNFNNNKYTNYTINAPVSIDGLIGFAYNEKNNKIYFTGYAGLFEFDVASGKINLLEIPKEFITNEIFYLIISPSKNELIGVTNSRIFIYNIYKKAVNILDKDDGVVPLFDYSAGVFVNDSTCVLSTEGGVNFINIAAAKRNFLANKKIIFTEFKINGKIQSIADPENFNLTYEKNSISIGFAYPDLYNGKKILYSYCLKGYADTFSELSHDNNANFINLPSGKYTFTVKALLPDGTWAKEISMVIIIRLPFWKKWWFILLCVLIPIVIIGLLIRQRFIKLQTQEKIRQRISKDLHDDLGSTLSSIGIYSKVAQNQLQTDVKKASETMQKINVNASELMRNMHDIIWSVDTKNDDMPRVISHLRELMAELFEPLNIQFEFNVRGNINKFKWNLEDRREFYLAIKECINNIVKHSKASTVKAELLVLSSAKLQFEISDNGIGFNLQNLKRINGLNNLINRIEKIGGKTTINSKVDEGTTILMNFQK